MTPTGSPDPNSLTRASTLGGVLAVVGIVAFIVLWIVLGQLNVDSAPRLVVSLCVPPLLLAVIVAVYAAVARNRA